MVAAQWHRSRNRKSHDQPPRIHLQRPGQSHTKLHMYTWYGDKYRTQAQSGFHDCFYIISLDCKDNNEDDDSGQFAKFSFFLRSSVINLPRLSVMGCLFKKKKSCPRWVRWGQLQNWLEYKKTYTMSFSFKRWPKMCLKISYQMQHQMT